MAMATIQIRTVVTMGKNEPQISIIVQSIQVGQILPSKNSDIHFLCSFVYSYSNYDYVDYPVQHYSSNPVIRVLQQIIRMAKNGKKIFHSLLLHPIIKHL